DPASSEVREIPSLIGTDTLSPAGWNLPIPVRRTDYGPTADERTHDGAGRRWQRGKVGSHNARHFHARFPGEVSAAERAKAAQFPFASRRGLTPRPTSGGLRPHTTQV